MKINEFQNRAANSRLGQQAKEMAGTSELKVPVQGTENFRRLIESISSDLIAAALAAEHAGVTLQYICEIALELSKGQTALEDEHAN